MDGGFIAHVLTKYKGSILVVLLVISSVLLLFDIALNFFKH